MSFILDALDRSRREREAHAADPVLPAADASAAASAGVPWVAVLLLALACALAAIAWLWISRMPGAEPAVAPTVAAPPERPPASALPAALPATPPSRDKPVAVAVPDASVTRVSSLYREARAASAPAAARAPQETPREARPRESDAVADARPDEGGKEQTGEPAVEAMVARAEAAMDNLGLAEHPAPMLEDLSQAVRDSIPTLIYSQHDYRAAGGESSVFINRERRRRGDSTAGVRVQEILPDSVVLDYRGTVFRLRALNSWVNL